MSHTLTKTTDRSTAPVIWSVGYVHGLSHLYMLALPPLFPLLRGDLNVSLVMLGGAVAAFNLVTALTQYVAGTLVDRFGGLRCLRLGLLGSLVTLALAALAPNFWLFAAAYCACGLANAVYHPADFKILNQRLPARQRAFGLSVHSFSGNIGFALAPALLAPVGLAFGWRAALGVAVLLGLPGIAALWGLSLRDRRKDARPVPSRAAAVSTTSKPAGISAMLKPAILLQLLIFTLFSIVSGGVQGFSVLAGAARFGYDLGTLNGVLSLYLLVGTLGIAACGALLQRSMTERQAFAAGIGLGMIGWALSWSGISGLYGYGAGMLAIGFAMGFILPARDLLVARATPEHLQGRTYGFVTTGINIGQFIAPALIGALIEHHHVTTYYAMMLIVLLASLIAGLAGRTAREQTS